MVDMDFSRNPQAPVLVIGGAGVDIIGRLVGEPHLGTSNPGRVRTSFGGVARNIAHNLARLGQPVEGKPTGTYLGIVNAKGLLQFAVDDMRVISQLRPDHIRKCADLFGDASLLFVDANLPKDTLRTVMSMARKARIPVCADPTSSILADRLRPYLSRLQLITPNSVEAAILFGQPFEAGKRGQALAAAKYLVGQGAQIALITLAEFGVCYATSETSGHFPALRTEILDPTGAGDALAATVIFALLNGIPLDDAVQLGVTAASLTLRYPGSVLPDLSLEKLYDHLVT
ncbi:MAG: carbohydrate kinase family protein [Anaerolineales bacterium]